MLLSTFSYKTHPEGAGHGCVQLANPLVGKNVSRRKFSYDVKDITIFKANNEMKFVADVWSYRIRII